VHSDNGQNPRYFQGSQGNKKMEDASIITLTTDIVSAHVSNNSVAPADLPHLIKLVFDALSSAGEPAAVVEEKREPAVSVRASVKPNSLTCLECGKTNLKMLKRHLMTDHNLSPAQYRERWNLKSDYPVVAPDYAAKRAELAKKIGLGRKPGTRMKPSAGKKPGRPKKAAAAPAAPAAE
jgi:predicted transcriptional regulator